MFRKDNKMASKPVMIDYTEELLTNSTIFQEGFTQDMHRDQFDKSTCVTIDMLRKRPDIVEALMEPLKDVMIPWEDESLEEPDDYLINQLIIAVNLDPFIQTTVFECLMGITDVSEAEGDIMYRPSIFDTDDFNELQTYIGKGGFREDHEPVPAKYDHLSEEHQDMIYINPKARKMLSGMPPSEITDELVNMLCSKS